MANLKLIRTRIKSVQSTQKITKAMRLVAAAKVRRAQQRVLASRPYHKSLDTLIANAVKSLDSATINDFPLLKARPIKKVALYVISSDRGLCGSYNSQVFRNTLDRIDYYSSRNIEPVLVTVGSKAITFFKNTNYKIIKSYTQMPAVPTVEEAKMLYEYASELFINKEVDSIEIISTKFISMLTSKIDNYPYLPMVFDSHIEEEKTKLQSLLHFEPTIETILQDTLIPMYLQNIFYQVLIEAAASELAARMNAMTNASNNARDLINSLTLVYNKARQASITQEILEIVGGAEALKG